jgi:alkylation response protein AidB-like acyl-CoA dehydrogenase
MGERAAIGTVWRRLRDVGAMTASAPSRRHDFPHRLSAALASVDVPDTHGSFPSEALDRLRWVHALEATLPVGRAGGLGLSDPARADVLRAALVAVGAASQVLGRLYEGHVNAHALIFRYGDAEARERTIADTEAGHLFGVWNTEPASAGLTVDPANGRLLGGKMFASGAGHVTRPLVTARMPDGTSRMFVTPLDADERSDLSRWTARGMRASATGSVSLQDYPLARAIRVGKTDDYHREPFFSAGAWRFLAVHLGGIEAVHREHKAHLLRLARGEDPHQLARLGQSGLAVETARAFVERACALAHDPSVDPRSVIAYVGLARTAVERAGLDVIELAQRSVGLASMLEDHPLERMTRDLSVYLRQPGPDYALATAARRLIEIGGSDLGADRLDQDERDVTDSAA